MKTERVGKGGGGQPVSAKWKRRVGEKTTPLYGASVNPARDRETHHNFKDRTMEERREGWSTIKVAKPDSQKVERAQYQHTRRKEV